MNNEAFQNTRRKLSFRDPHRSQQAQPSFNQFYLSNHSSNYLQLAINNFNQLIKQSEEQIYDEQQAFIYEENTRLNKIQNLQNDINHLQTNIDALNKELERLNSQTYEMLVRQNESALFRHHQLLKESIEHINHVLRRRSISNDSSLDQLKKDLTNQQEKLFLIRNQLDIDHNKLATNMSLVKECQEQRNQFEQMKSKKQMDLQNIQQSQIDHAQKQLRLQRLRSSLEQQIRVRNDIQQLEQSTESSQSLQQERSPQTHVYRQELDLTKERTLEIVDEIDEDTIDTNERYLKTPEQRHNRSSNKLNDYRNDSD